LSKIFPSSSLGPEPGNLSQNGQKPTAIMTSLTNKNLTQNQKNYIFIAELLHLLRV